MTRPTADVQEPHRPVEAPSEVLAELRERLDTDTDSRELARYAIGLGLQPPPEPANYPWAIVEVYDNDDFDNGVLYWWGPDDEEPSDEP